MSLPKNFGGVALAATTNTDVFQAPADGCSYSVTVVNRGVVDATIRLGVSDTSVTFENANYLEYDLVVPASGVLNLTGMIMEDDTKYLVAYSDVTNVTVSAYGWSA